MAIRLGVDLRGGDYGAGPIVQGVKRFLEDTDDVDVVVYGLKEDAHLVEDGHRLFFKECDEEITPDEQPTRAVKAKGKSTLVCAMNDVKNKKIYGILSAGSTGAVLTAAYLILGRIKGIKRPMLAVALPTIKGDPFVIGDIGANSDVRPEFFVGFSVLGRVYYEVLLGRSNASVSILNIGTEVEKGNQIVKDAREMLQKYDWFRGYVEPHAVWHGGYDVVITDGFSGNIFLKTAEGVFSVITHVIKDNIKNGGIFTKLGAFMMKNVFVELKDKFDYKSYGGAPFLGVNGLVMKMHGRSDEEAVYSALRSMYKLAKADIIGKIISRLAEVKEYG